MLFIIALEMVSKSAPSGVRNGAEEIKGTPEARTLRVSDGHPMIAGPRLDRLVMLLTARADGLTEGLIVLAAMTTSSF